MYTGSANLNMADQYVEILNKSGAPVNISNWRIQAVSSGKYFDFPNGLVLQAGQTCRVYNNSAPVSTGGCGPFYFNTQAQVWSTTHDTAQLFDSSHSNLMAISSY